MRTKLTRRARLPLAAAMLSICSGCGAGALEQSVTADDCGPDDARCLMAGLGAPVAVGATVRPQIATKLRGSGAPALLLHAAAPDVLQVQGDTMTGRSPGVSAMLMSLQDGAVLDFVHVWVTAPTRLELHRFEPGGADRGALRDAVELVRGESLWVAPRAYAGAQRLLGEGSTEWSVEPPIARVLRDGSLGRRRLLAMAPGRAKVTVKSLGLIEQLELMVHDQPNLEASP